MVSWIHSRSVGDHNFFLVGINYCRAVRHTDSSCQMKVISMLLGGLLGPFALIIWADSCNNNTKLSCPSIYPSALHSHTHTLKVQECKSLSMKLCICFFTIWKLCRGPVLNSVQVQSLYISLLNLKYIVSIQDISTFNFQVSVHNYEKEKYTMCIEWCKVIVQNKAVTQIFTVSVEIISLCAVQYKPIYLYVVQM